MKSVYTEQITNIIDKIRHIKPTIQQIFTDLIAIFNNII